MIRSNRRINRIESWRERLRSPERVTLLGMIKAEARGLGFSPSWGAEVFQIAVILLAAAFLIGPLTEQLGSFTGYPADLIDRVQRNMRKYGLWAGGTVHEDAWFNDDGSWKREGILVHVLVAQGRLIARQRKDGQWEYRGHHSFVKEEVSEKWFTPR